MGVVDTDGFQPLAVDTDQLQPLPYYEKIVIPVVGLSGIIEGWRVNDAVDTGTAFGVKRLFDMSAGAQVVQGVASGVAARPVAANITRASPGDAFNAGNPAALDFDARTDPFSIFLWARMSGTGASGLFGRQLSAAGAGYQACLRPDVNPDQMQWRVRDGAVLRTATIIDNAVSDGAWHMWTFVNDPSASGAQLRLHLDKNAPVTTDTSGLGDTSNAGNVLIGDDLSFQSMQGDLNHVYFCNLALSQPQVNALYDGGT